jgi:hypothetical protein
MTKLMTIVALVVTLISASTFTASAGPFSRTHSRPAKHRKDSL